MDPIIKNEQTTNESTTKAEDATPVNEVGEKIEDTTVKAEDTAVAPIPSAIDEKVAEMKRQEKADFEKFQKFIRTLTPAQVEEFVKKGKQLASRAVLTFLCNLVKEGPARGLDKEECDELVALLEAKIEFDKCGRTEFKLESPKVYLCVSLTPSVRDFVPQIEVPDKETALQLYHMYDFVKTAAISYYAGFAMHNIDLIERLHKYMVGVDFTKIRLDEKIKTSMYIDPNAETRLSVQPFYTDYDGNPYVKRQRR